MREFHVFQTHMALNFAQVRNIKFKYSRLTSNQLQNSSSLFLMVALCFEECDFVKLSVKFLHKVIYGGNQSLIIISNLHYVYIIRLLFIDIQQKTVFYFQLICRLCVRCKDIYSVRKY